MLLFAIALTCSTCAIPNLDIGISQTVALPRDSFLMDYFDYLGKYLKTGAPVYFVVKDGYNYSETDFQNKVCGSAGCQADSIPGTIYMQSLISNYSGIALPAQSWIDDYFSWLDPSSSCCSVINFIQQNKSGVIYNNYTRKGEFCPATSPKNFNCSSCLNITQEGQRPTPDEFNKYITWFLKDNPGVKCAKGGHAAYANAVTLNLNKSAEEVVKSSYFMTYHTVSVTSPEFISNLKYAREIAKNMTKTLNHDVFAYSVFYVFYEQYLTVVNDAWKDLLISLGAIFMVTVLLMGFNVGLAACISITVAMIVVNLMGFMKACDIPLNAVSLVNLVMAVGISVEFCSHIARAYSTSPYSTRVLRAKDGLGKVGSSVSEAKVFLKAKCKELFKVINTSASGVSRGPANI